MLTKIAKFLTETPENTKEKLLEKPTCKKDHR